MSVTPASYGPTLGLGILTGNEVASAVGPTKVPGPKGNKQTRGKKDDEANYTTIMLRNIPNKYSRQMLIDQLHSAGFQGQIDYLYLPIDFANRCNVGYCFINFRTSQARQHFNSMFDNVAAQSCLPGFNSYKVCQVTKAKWQGRDENVRRIRSGPELMQQLAGHPDWLPVLLDEQGNQEPFLLDDLPGKQAAQKGRNNKKQILAPGALSRGAGQVPGLSELLEGSRVGNAGGKKNANGKALQGMAKSKNAKGKQPKTQDMASPMIAMPQFQMQQWLQAAASMGACGACGVPMPMMAGGFPMQAMQPTMYDGMDANVLMAGMMPFAGNVDMSQYMAAFGTQSYPYSNGDAFEYSDMRGAENQEEEEEEGEEEEENPAMAPSYIPSPQMT